VDTRYLLLSLACRIRVISVVNVAIIHHPSLIPHPSLHLGLIFLGAQTIGSLRFGLGVYVRVLYMAFSGVCIWNIPYDIVWLIVRHGLMGMGYLAKLFFY
jgi:hypothetical protein